MSVSCLAQWWKASEWQIRDDYAVPALIITLHVIRCFHPSPPPHWVPANDTPGEEETGVRGGRWCSSVIPVLWPNLTQAQIMRQRGMRQRILPKTRLLTRKCPKLADNEPVVSVCNKSVQSLFIWIQRHKRARIQCLIFHLQALTYDFIVGQLQGGMHCSSVWFDFVFLQEALTFQQ